jgi:hypothetical protein
MEQEINFAIAKTTAPASVNKTPNANSGEAKRILIRMAHYSFVAYQLLFQIHNVAPHARTNTQATNAAALVTHDQWFL